MAAFALVATERVATAADLAASAPATPTVSTAPSPFYLRLGGAGIWFDESARVSVGGTRVPGGNARVDDDAALLFEGGYHFTPSWSAALTLGVPPTTTLSGAGTLKGAGKLGDVSYGPLVASLRYHLLDRGPILPYVGAGATYTLIFGSTDRALRNIKVENGFGPVLVGGFDVPLTDRYGVFVDVKKIWLTTDATFDEAVAPGAAVPGKASVTLDPLVLTAGFQLRF